MPADVAIRRSAARRGANSSPCPLDWPFRPRASLCRRMGAKRNKTPKTQVAEARNKTPKTQVASRETRHPKITSPEEEQDARDSSRSWSSVSPQSSSARSVERKLLGSLAVARMRTADTFGATAGGRASAGDGRLSLGS